jgi:hypothetical protein
LVNQQEEEGDESEAASGGALASLSLSAIPQVNDAEFLPDDLVAIFDSSFHNRNKKLWEIFTKALHGGVAFPTLLRHSATRDAHARWNDLQQQYRPQSSMTRSQLEVDFVSQQQQQDQSPDQWHDRSAILM